MQTVKTPVYEAVRMWVQINGVGVTVAGRLRGGKWARNTNAEGAVVNFPHVFSTKKKKGKRKPFGLTAYPLRLLSRIGSRFRCKHRQVLHPP